MTTGYMKAIMNLLLHSNL